MNTTSILRQINALRALRLLRWSSPMSRADIARELKLTRSTAGNAIKSLLDSGLVLEAAEADPLNRVGRPSVGVSINSAGGYAIGIDIGTRVVSGLLVDLAMQVKHRVSVPNGTTFRDPQATGEKVLGVIERLRKEADVSADAIIGAGVSVPGLVDNAGQVVNAPFLEWRDYPMRDVLVRRLSADWRVDVLNDAVALATAEGAARQGDQAGSLLVVLLAEGIGSALVQDGRILSGAHGQAGEIGHTILPSARGPASFEMLAGAPAFAEFFGPDTPVDIAIGEFMTNLSDPRSKQVLDVWCGHIAVGLANAIHVLDPHRVVLGGPLALLYSLREQEALKAITALLLPGFTVPDISVTRYTADGAAIGAAAAVLNSLFALPDLS
ncbi:MAG: ROK family transcriptional regulator [Devosia sp.]|nr:ROK family transcriptional regulator [Devosia sp.]